MTPPDRDTVYALAALARSSIVYAPDDDFLAAEVLGLGLVKVTRAQFVELVGRGLVAVEDGQDGQPHAVEVTEAGRYWLRKWLAGLVRS